MKWFVRVYDGEDKDKDFFEVSDDNITVDGVHSANSILAAAIKSALIDLEHDMRNCPCGISFFVSGTWL